jgi:hypothetical protein
MRCSLPGIWRSRAWQEASANPFEFAGKLPVMGIPPSQTEPSLALRDSQPEELLGLED